MCSMGGKSRDILSLSIKHRELNWGSINVLAMQVDWHIAGDKVWYLAGGR